MAEMDSGEGLGGDCGADICGGFSRFQTLLNKARAASNGSPFNPFSARPSVERNLAGIELKTKAPLSPILIIHTHIYIYPPSRSLDAIFISLDWTPR